jgi:hypothetical protein
MKFCLELERRGIQINLALAVLLKKNGDKIGHGISQRQWKSTERKASKCHVIQNSISTMIIGEKLLFLVRNYRMNPSE